MYRRLPLAFALMVTGLFMFVPTPDELLIHPCSGYVISKLFNMDFKSGVLWSIGVYNGIGVVFVLLSILLGGKVVIAELNVRVEEQKSKIEKILINNSIHRQLLPRKNLVEEECAFACTSLDLFD